MTATCGLLLHETVAIYIASRAAR